MTVAGFEGTEEKANFDSLITPIMAANPDLIYFGGMYSQSAVLFKQARDKGYKGMYLSDDGFDSSDAAKIAGQALLDGAGTYYSTVSGPASVYPDTAKFVADFKAAYNSDPQPFAAQGYDSMAICLKAIENAANGQWRSAHPRRSGNRRARPQGLQRHHRHVHLQLHRRPDHRSVLRDPGDFARSGQVELEHDHPDPEHRSTSPVEPVSRYRISRPLHRGAGRIFILRKHPCKDS